MPLTNIGTMIREKMPLTTIGDMTGDVADTAKRALEKSGVKPDYKKYPIIDDVVSGDPNNSPIPPVIGGTIPPTTESIPTPGSPQRFDINFKTPGARVTQGESYLPPTLPGAPDVKSFDPVTRELDPTKETVEGRLTSLLDKESDYMKGARYRGEAFANKRGLLNTSMAGGAGEASAIEAGLPIAQQDAGTFFQQGRANQDAANQLRGMEAGQEYGLQGAGFEGGMQQKLMEQGHGQELESMRQDAAIRAQITELDAQVRERLANVEQGYALELESLKQSYEITANRDTQMGQMYADALKSIATFMDDPDMSSVQQKTGLDTIVSNLQAGLEFMAGITQGPESLMQTEVTTAQQKAVAERQLEADIKAAKKEGLSLQEYRAKKRAEEEAETPEE